MKTSKAGLDFIRSFEGYHTKLPNGDCKAYWDATGKVWTIGWGCTEGVSKGDVWTEAKAKERFAIEMRKHEAFVEGLCKEFNFTPNQNQFDALVSHSYNCGPGGTRKVMKAKFNFMVYGQTSGGKRLPGLVRRRKDEQKLFNTPTTKELKTSLKKNSRSYRFGERFNKFLEFTGIGALLSMATFQEVKDYLLDPKLLIALVLGFATWVAIKYLNFRTLEAARERRYILRSKK